jgi:hypothetical protein
MAERRTLNFALLDEVMPDVERLLAGHSTVGQWSLGQICNHLARTISGSVDGFPTLAPWLIRRTVGPLAFRGVDRLGRLPTGVKAAAYLIPPPGLDARAEAEALGAAIARFQALTGPAGEHPFFGRMSLARLTRAHCLHCAHHLSFARPEEEGQDRRDLGLPPRTMSN